MNKDALLLYDQELDAQEVLSYLPDTFLKKLTVRERRQICDAFRAVVSKYKSKYDENYLTRMLI